MSNLNREQVLDIADIINGRLLEYGEGVFEPLAAGVVRLAFDEIERWMATHDYLGDDDLRPMPPRADPIQGDLLMDHYWVGFEAGKRKMSPPAREEGYAEVAPKGYPTQEWAAANADPRAADAPPQNNNEKLTDLLAEGPSGLPADIGAGMIAMAIPMLASEPPPRDDEKLTGVEARQEQVIAAIAAMNSARAETPVPPFLSPEALTPLVPCRPRTLAEADADSATEQLATALATDLASDKLDELRARIIGNALPDALADEDGDAPELRTTRADMAAMRMGSEEKAARLREIIGVLQDKSVNGMMPSMAEWEEIRPAHLPRTQALMKQYDITWSDLAARARLQIKKAGPLPGTRKPGRVGSPDPTSR